MKNAKLAIVLMACMATTFLTGCQTTSSNQLLKTSDSQVKMRNIQTRAFETADKNKMLRSVIATLQDLGFVVDKADEVLGTVSATKLDKYMLKMTVSVRPKGEEQVLVRANGQLNITPVEDPELYQDFFTSLSKSVFLAAHSVD